ncbi:glyoxal oxidase N-terminus-domain-containing protein, partial [Chytriomyces sp. MP71]
MTTFRWYPTVVTLGDGTLFIASGATKNIVFEDLTNTINPTYEYFPRKYQDAIHSQLLEWSFPHNLYPIAFQLPRGKIFMMASNDSVLIDPTVDPSQTDPAKLAEMPWMDHAPWIYPHTPTAFLLPMKESENWTATVVVCGGSMSSTKDASADCVSLQPEVDGAQWKNLTKMPNARLMPDAVLLPDGTVLVTNGVGWGQAGG